MAGKIPPRESTETLLLYATQDGALVALMAECLSQLAFRARHAMKAYTPNVSDRLLWARQMSAFLVTFHEACASAASHGEEPIRTERLFNEDAAFGAARAADEIRDVAGPHAHRGHQRGARADAGPAARGDPLAVR